ncbi:MAG: PPE domain-containing protein, partial [Mycobacterium sp.]
MGDGVKVDTADLRAKAKQVANVEFGDPAALVSGVQAPDSLPHTQRTMEHLEANAKYLAENQEYAKTEQQRLSETLLSVAKAYDDFDEAARHSLDSGGPAPAPVIPQGSGTAEPTPPGNLPAPSRTSSGGNLFIDKAQDALGSGDHGASLETAKTAWDTNGVNLQRAGATFIAPIVNWEGDAADEAYGKFFNYGNWITLLGQKWQALAVEAHKIVDAHLAAVGDHNPVYNEYKSLEAKMTTENQMQTMSAMDKLNKESEHIQDTYTAKAAVDRVTVDQPPPPVGAPTSKVDANGDPRKLPSDWKDGQSPQQPGATAPGGGGGGGGQPPGSTPSVPQTPSPATSPMSAEQAGNKSPSGAGSGSGGGSPSGGGSGSGGGSPSGSPSGLPGGGPEDMPGLPDDPGLH